MKKVLFAAVIISIGFSACKKDNDAQPEKVKIQKNLNDGEDDGGDNKGNDGGGWGG